MKDLIYGVGIYEKGKYQSKIGSKRTKEYELWASMLKRCYSERHLIKMPSYRGCSVSYNFKNFQFFAEWCNSSVGFGNENWCLDKDILFKNNKIYSENTCCFVPREINILLTKRKNNRGNYPIGVIYHKSSGYLHAKITKEGRRVFLGQFTDPKKAFECYKEAKEFRIKELADKFKQDLHNEVYKALYNYKVEITD